MLHFIGFISTNCLSSCRASVVCLLLIAALSLSSLSHAQPKPLDKAHVDEFIQHSISSLMEKSWIPGATVAVVQGDKIVSLQGIGTANFETGQLIDPEKTLFRIGSVSKTMTALAALRMLDMGQLDYQSDINKYLKSVSLPNSFDKPVTLQRLLTHHGGFDTMTIFHMVVNDNDGVAMTAQEVQPELIRVRPVDSPRTYDNLGHGVLGFLLQEVQGKSFREVMKSEVFDPLKMSHAVVGLPDERWQDASQCHEPGSGNTPQFCDHQLLRNLVQGAGDISATASDMANFMRALIKPEEILKPQTAAQLMDFNTSRIHPRMPGMGLTLVEQEFGGRRCRGHGGSIAGFVSMFCIFPEQKVGLFVSVNGNDEAMPELSLSGMIKQAIAEGPDMDENLLAPRALVETFFADFAREFIPEADAISSTGAATPKFTGTVEGTYFRPDASNSLWGKLMSPLFSMTVTSSKNGELMIGDTGPFIAKSPLYYEYEEVENGVTNISQVAFGYKSGETLMAGNAYNMNVRQPWYATLQWTLLPFAFCSLVLLITTVYSLSGKKQAYKKVLHVAAGSFGLLIAGMVLELEYAYLVHQGEISSNIAVIWRSMFPLSVLGFLYFLLKFPSLWWQKINSNIGGKVFFSSFFFLIYLSCLMMVWLSIHWGLVMKLVQ